MGKTFVGEVLENINGKLEGKVWISYLGQDKEITALNFFKSPILKGREVVVTGSVHGWLIVAVED